MKSYVFLAFILLSLAGAGCFLSGSNQQDQAPDAIDRDAVLLEAQRNGLIMDEAEIAAMSATTPVPDQTAQTPEDAAAYLEQDVRGWADAALADVTGGESFGIARATFVSGTFTLLVEMGNLPEPAEGYFYEGWLVRRGEDLSVVSTGRAQKTQEGFANVYLSQQDLSGYGFYVLTLEPDDTNPSPSEHILEGSLK